MKKLRLYLASASPRRLELLRQLGLDPRRLDHHVAETPVEGESPETTVRRLAIDKGRAAAAALDPAAEPGVVLAADTLVTLDRAILGKPVDSADAARMLRLLRGRTHEVLTGLFVVRTDDRRETDAVETTRVRFRSFDDATLDAYVASGEPLDKAGAYGIQGLGALLSEGMRGSWSNVVGLPLERLPGCMARIGVDPVELFRGNLGPASGSP